jgi:hypothetical protein
VVAAKEKGRPVRDNRLRVPRPFLKQSEVFKQVGYVNNGKVLAISRTPATK